MRELEDQAEFDPELSPEALTKRFGFDVLRDFDLDKPEFNEHFQEVMDFVVQKCPVVHSPTGRGYTVFNTEEAVRTAGQDWQTFSSAKGYMHNRPENLRAVSRSLNMRNLASKPGVSRRRGVTWRWQTKCWVARIRINGKRVFLGEYAALKEAIAAREKAEAANGYTNRRAGGQ